MALPICLEFFIRAFFHIIKFSFTHFNLIFFICIIALLSFVFKKSIRLILGVIGFIINLLGFTGILAPFTPFAEAITWGAMALSANMFFLGKIILVPIMMVLGFSWDAFTGGTYVTNAVPLSIIMAVLMDFKIFNWLVILAVIFLSPVTYVIALTFKIAGFQNICSAFNVLLQKYAIILPVSPKLLKTYFKLLKKWQKNLE